MCPAQGLSNPSLIFKKYRERLSEREVEVGELLFDVFLRDQRSEANERRLLHGL